MQTTLVITFIANDRPGLIETLSACIQAHQGNWLESKLAQLAGKFTGIIEVNLPKDNVNALQEQLSALQSQGISVLLESVEQGSQSSENKHGLVSIIGLDRAGIVNEISAALAAHHINVESFDSIVEAAPMSGEALFKAELDISLPKTTDIDELDEKLESIALSLDIEYQLSITY